MQIYALLRDPTYLIINLIQKYHQLQQEANQSSPQFGLVKAFSSSSIDLLMEKRIKRRQTW